ncbi:DNA/RNA non-specific endonuclease [Tsukamurella ocularis]|uniref:DNA/RNA non-specific endonuclease n=1 Tax=Tsukamurella ocularis TaxID=1970234 RepID=UPI002166C5E0|nr:DNA/RNA non-specific endonuclease [Tsukamurella ocularis]MCS3781605.1 hypothetical protein [Tsukamurella ocularis]MCS3787977.1 hypothetical protein [Tsukamurella ocularis]MCS3851272.1 hypothetical protein [Tsukamurella ocularis]
MSLDITPGDGIVGELELLGDLIVGGFPEAVFTLPGVSVDEVLDHARLYLGFAEAAQTAQAKVRALELPEFVGVEGEFFRGRVPGELAMQLGAAVESYSRVGSGIKELARELDASQTALKPLEARARAVFEHMQKVWIKVNVPFTEYSGLRSEWDELVRAAGVVHERVAAAGQQAAAQINAGTEAMVPVNDYFSTLPGGAVAGGALAQGVRSTATRAASAAGGVTGAPGRAAKATADGLGAVAGAAVSVPQQITTRGQQLAPQVTPDGIKVGDQLLTDPTSEQAQKLVRDGQATNILGLDPTGIPTAMMMLASPNTLIREQPRKKAAGRRWSSEDSKAQSIAQSAVGQVVSVPGRFVGGAVDRFGNTIAGNAALIGVGGDPVRAWSGLLSNVTSPVAGAGRAVASATPEQILADPIAAAGSAATHAPAAVPFVGWAYGIVEALSKPGELAREGAKETLTSALDTLTLKNLEAGQQVANTGEVHVTTSDVDVHADNGGYVTFTLPDLEGGEPKAWYILATPDSPGNFTTDVPTAPGEELIERADGSVVLVNSGTGQIVRTIKTPWAKDALGRDQPTWYSVERLDDSASTITQHIAPNKGALYPLVADAPGDQKTTTNPDGSVATSTEIEGGSVDTTVKNADGTTSSMRSVPDGNGGVTTFTANPDGSHSVHYPDGSRVEEPAAGASTPAQSYAPDPTYSNPQYRQEPAQQAPAQQAPVQQPAAPSAPAVAPAESSVGAVDTAGRDDGDSWTQGLPGGESAQHTIVPGTGGQTVDSVVTRPDGSSTKVRSVKDGQGGWKIWSDNSDGTASYAERQGVLGDVYTARYGESPVYGSAPIVTSNAAPDNSKGQIVGQNPNGTTSVGNFGVRDDGRVGLSVRNPDNTVSSIVTGTGPDGRPHDDITAFNDGKTETSHEVNPFTGERTETTTVLDTGVKVIAVLDRDNNLISRVQGVGGQLEGVMNTPDGQVEIQVRPDGVYGRSANGEFVKFREDGELPDTRSFGQKANDQAGKFGSAVGGSVWDSLKSVPQTVAHPGEAASGLWETAKGLVGQEKADRTVIHNWTTFLTGTNANEWTEDGVATSLGHAVVGVGSWFIPGPGWVAKVTRAGHLGSTAAHALEHVDNARSTASTATRAAAMGAVSRALPNLTERFQGFNAARAADIGVDAPEAAPAAGKPTQRAEAPAPSAAVPRAEAPASPTPAPRVEAPATTAPRAETPNNTPGTPPRIADTQNPSVDTPRIDTPDAPTTPKPDTPAVGSNYKPFSTTPAIDKATAAAEHAAGAAERADTPTPGPDKQAPRGTPAAPDADPTPNVDTPISVGDGSPLRHGDTAPGTSRLDPPTSADSPSGNIDLRAVPASEVVSDGSHINPDGSLKPNTVYQAGEHGYRYRTDENGHIVQFDAENLQLKTHTGRLNHDPNTPGKLPGDHAGHLGADRFGGSEKLDNIVSQFSKINLSSYKILENEWSRAIQAGKDVSVKVDITNDATGRPTRFEIEYTIDGELFTPRPLTQ